MLKKSKGFMLAEVVVSSTVVLVALVTLYASFTRVYNRYKTVDRYFNIDGLYAIRSMVNEIPILTLVVILSIFVYMENYCTIPLARDVIFLTRLPELCYGMYFVKYIKTINLPTFIVSIVIFVLNWLIKPSIPNDVQVLYIGIVSFNILIFISEFVEKSKVIVDISNYISKYSYSIFLTHHVIIAYVTSTFILNDLSKKGSCVLFLICCSLTMIISKWLYNIEKKVVSKVKDYISNVNYKKLKEG